MKNAWVALLAGSGFFVVGMAVHNRSLQEALLALSLLVNAVQLKRRVGR